MTYLSAEQRRQSIVDAAIAVIAEEGLAGATTRRIAERAKAPLGALHYCFRNKNELIELVAERGAAMLKSCFDGVDPSRGFEETLRDSVAAMWHWVRENGGLQLALMELGMWRIRQGGPPEEVYAMWDRFGGDLLRANIGAAARLAKAKPAISVDEIARFINHRFDGLAFEYAASRDEAACERQTLLLADALVLLALPAKTASPVRKARRTAIRT